MFIHSSSGRMVGSIGMVVVLAVSSRCKSPGARAGRPAASCARVWASRAARGKGSGCARLCRMDRKNGGATASARREKCALVKDICGSYGGRSTAVVDDAIRRSVVNSRSMVRCSTWNLGQNRRRCPGQGSAWARGSVICGTGSPLCGPAAGDPQGSLARAHAQAVAGAGPAVGGGRLAGGNLALRRRGLLLARGVGRCLEESSHLGGQLGCHLLAIQAAGRAAARRRWLGLCRGGLALGCVGAPLGGRSCSSHSSGALLGCSGGLGGAACPALGRQRLQCVGGGAGGSQTVWVMSGRLVPSGL